MRALGVFLAAVLGGCTFARISLDNVVPLFSDPEPAPRRDTPGDPNAAVAVLWIGHATTLIQMYDKYVLTDPVLVERVGTLSRRIVAAGLDANDLPSIDVTLVSHRHFDHLSRETFERVGDKLHDIVTPPDAGADIPPGPYFVRELAWDASVAIDGVTITAMRVVHDGGRVLDADEHPRAFTGYVVQYRDMTVYFGGDTAYAADIFDAVHARFPVIDVAVLPIGPVEPVDVMSAHHMDPEQALLAALQLEARHVVPIHFDTFVNSYDDPGDCARLYDAALAATDFGDRASRLLIGENRRLVEAAASVP